MAVGGHVGGDICNLFIIQWIRDKGMAMFHGLITKCRFEKRETPKVTL